VARLGGYTLKKVSTADDLTNRTLTITLTGISGGFVQETLPWEREDLTAHVNGRGEVEKLDGLQIGDLAETEAEANAEIAAAAPPVATTNAAAAFETVNTGTTEGFQPRLVGELAGAARQNKKKR